VKSGTWKNAFEAIGILALIASLLFVAMELKQSNQLGRLAALESMASEWNSVNIQFAANDVLAELLTRVSAGAVSADFTEIENTRLANVFGGLDHHWELRYKQLQLGVLEPHDFSFPRLGNTLFDSNYHRELWSSRRPGYSDEFAAYWEQRFNLISE